MNKKEILEYIGTLFLTLAIITVVVIVVVFFVHHKAKNPPTQKEIQEFKTNQINMLIDSYKYREKNEKNNYEVNLKLGLIYENTGKFKEAEQEYIKAVKKAPYLSLEPTFELATLYVGQGKLDKAVSLVASIREYPDKSIIKSKAIFYSKVAKAYYEIGNFEMAKVHYLNALYYQNKTKIKSFDVKKELPQVYISIANDLVKQGKKERAIGVLESGIKITNSELLMYKLGKLHIESNPEEALVYFDKVAKIDPYIIDFNVYKSLLNKLVASAKLQNDEILITLYTEKYKRICRYMDNNIVKNNDFEIEVVKSKYEKYPLNLGNSIDVAFKIKNNTSRKVSRLFVQAKIYDNEKLIKTVDKRIATLNNPILPGKTSQQMHVKMNYEDLKTHVLTNDVMVIVSVNKNERIPSTFIAEIVIPKS